MERPSAILLDLAGTTTDLALVSRRLAAFLTAPTSAQSYLRETFDRPETKELVRRLREARGGATEEEQAQLPPILSPSSSRDKLIKSLGDFAGELLKMQQKEIQGSQGSSQSSSQKASNNNNSSSFQRFAAVTAELTALLWCWALEEGKLVGHLYDEVTFTLHQWAEQLARGGLRTYVFSAHQNLHQRLLLAATNHGNLEPLVSGYFDAELGPPTEPASYRRILREIAQENSAPLGGKVLYVTAVPKQASAALEAGLKVALIQRTPSSVDASSSSPEGALISELKEAGVLLISTLDELKFK
ncbi:Enolase-phosphatase E1 [Tyrophagus putrescentiae]|nr:Enolase-phosphatase E1 [Tyrophagus putrescentiae]